MENFKLASQQKLRFQTNKGQLSTEQLWDLSLDELNDLAVSLDADYNESGKKSFLVAKTAKDKTLKLKFDVVLDVLNTKAEAIQAASDAQAVREHNKKIIALIQEKKDDSLKGKSIAQLEKMLQ